MEHKITTMAPAQAPEQRVVLDLSVEEFAGLFILHNEAGGGDPAGLRGLIERGLHAAKDALDPAWQEVITSAEGPATGYAYERVEKVFS